MEDLRLAELLASLSLATDLANAYPPEKTLRTCLVALGVGRAAGLVGRDLSDAYYSGLLRYVGCTSFAYEEAAYFGGDDNALRNLYAGVDFGRPIEVLAVTITQLAKDRPPLVRARAVATFVSGGAKLGARLSSANCEVGVRLATRLGMSAGVIEAVGQVVERWDGKGPGGLRGEQIGRVARVMHVAHVAEIFYRLGGSAGAREVVARRRGTQLDPAFADAFLGAADEILAPFEAPSVWDAAITSEPEPRRWSSTARLNDLARTFADFADLKSPYTLGHSPGVAELADRAAAALGVATEERAALQRAALLHDLGRVSVPNGIWDKRGRLGAAEWERVRLHAYHTERILAPAAALRPFAAIAGMHHERLDGSGYHRGLPAALLRTPARLLAAADVYQALGEERPHRPALAPEAAAKEVEREVAAGRLDREAARAVLEVSGHEVPRARTPWPGGLSDREVEVLRLMVRGKTNKQMAATLSLSDRTVQSHVLHIYAKIGQSSRSAAALFAMENDLLRG